MGLFNSSHRINILMSLAEVGIVKCINLVFLGAGSDHFEIFYGTNFASSWCVLIGSSASWKRRVLIGGVNMMTEDNNQS